MCVGDLLTDDSASPLQQSESKRSTLPGGASLAHMRGVGSSGVLMQPARPGWPRDVQWLSARCVVWGEWRLGTGLETIITTL